MSFQRLLSLIAALGSEDSDTCFGKPGLEHVASCTKTHGDKNRLRVSLLLPDPSHPHGHPVHCSDVALCVSSGCWN